MTAPTASRRISRGSGGVPPRPGGRGGSRWARRLTSQVRTSTGSDERGQYDNGTRPPGRHENRAYGLVPVNVRTHRASRTLSNDVPGLAAHRDRRRPDDGRSSVSGLALDGASSQIGSTVASGAATLCTTTPGDSLARTFGRKLR